MEHPQLENTQTFKTDSGLEIHYAVLEPQTPSEGEGKLPIVLIHGLAGSRYSWADIAAPFVEKGHTVFLTDSRGHGNSQRSPGEYTVTKYAADMVELVDNVVKGPVIVGGHSLGAVMSYFVAHARPDLVKSVLLEDPPMYLSENFAASPYKALFEQALQDTLTWQSQGKTAKEIAEIMSTRPGAADGTTMGALYTPEGLFSTAHGRAFMDPEMWRSSLEGKMADHDANKGVQVPGILLRADGKMGAAFMPDQVERFAKVAPNVKVVEVEGCGHSIHQTKKYRDVVIDSLAKCVEMASK